MSKAPFILLVNPWITDFAAFDLWAKPLGLLILGALLRQGGCGVAFIDCLNRRDPFTNARMDVIPGSDKKYGTGKYPRMRIPKPEALAGIPRHFHRYGVHPESLRRQLQSIPRPDLVWVTSMMTYWYGGVREAIGAIREVFPGVPVWLGGTYARLCARHAAEASGADEVVVSPVEELPSLIEAATGYAVKNGENWGCFEAWPLPALDLAPHLGYIPILTSRGCPYRCPYCASSVLNPKWERRGFDAILHEICHWHEETGLEDFAFYDDALLLGAETNLRPALERLAREGPKVRFHTPNALHVRALTPDWCRLLYESGFKTLRLGLETTRTDHQRQWGGKVETDMFFEGVSNLVAAGFSSERIGVYLLCGLPGQTPEEVAEAVRTVKAAGARPYLAEYSPVPGTPMWREAVSVSPFDIENEPLYHNNTFFACRRPDFTYNDLLSLKDLARRPQAQHRSKMK